VVVASSTRAEKFCRASARGTVVMYRILAHFSQKPSSHYPLMPLAQYFCAYKH
jgi:hypothetical protein